MKNKFSLLIFSLVLMFLLGSFAQVSACSCLNTSACQLVKDADAVFVGKVVASSETQTVEDRSEYNATANTSNPVAPKQIIYASGKIFFEVKEAFSGTKNGLRFTIVDNPSSCSVNFRLDETYLIYAYKSQDGSFSTSLCATKSLNAAAEDLEFLRNPPKAGAGTKIFGVVMESVNNYFAEGILAKHLGNAKIEIQSTSSPKKVYFATTDAEGKYETVVPAGTYKIAPVLPKYQFSESLFGDDEEIVKAQDRQCENRSFHIKNNSRVSGKIVDENGKPLENIEVELFLENTEPSLNATGESAETDEKGNFSFSGIPLGRYFLSVNFYKMPEDDSPYPRTFYPNAGEQSQAQIIEVNNGTKLNNLVFRLSAKLNKYKVEGKVTWSDGTPAANAEVRLMDEELNTTDYFKDIVTDADGKFILEGFEGRKYYVRAIVWKTVDESSKVSRGQAESEVFTLEGNKSEINLVLNENVPQTEDLPLLSKIYRTFFSEK